MQMPDMLRGDSLTRLIQGAVAGAVLTMALGFSWGGWVTGGTHAKMVNEASENATIAALAPICAKQFVAIDGVMTKFNAAESWNRDRIVMDNIAMIGDTKVGYPLGRACAEIVSKAAKTAENKS